MTVYYFWGLPSGGGGEPAEELGQEWPSLPSGATLAVPDGPTYPYHTSPGYGAGEASG